MLNSRKYMLENFSYETMKKSLADLDANSSNNKI